ncbi:MAG: alpha/beta fold hydrolase [Erythrobacter sp.]
MTMPARTPAPRTPVLRTITVNAIDLAFFDWPACVSDGAGVSDGADGAGPTMVFAHATGFHARVWDAVIEHFPQSRVIAIDLRGHGRSGGGPVDDWRLVASDVAGLIDQLGISGAVGVGHSMGAHVLVQCAADRPCAFAQLVLFDPVILAPDYYTAAETLFTPDNPHPASRRKGHFASAEAMIERFCKRDPYCLFAPRVFEDYCRHGLLPDPAGEGMVLACAPEVEGSIYTSSRSNTGILDAARAVDVPALVVRAQQSDLMDFKSSPTWPELAAIMPQGRDLHRPDRTHFHPFEDPADAARIIADFLA